MDCTHQTWAHLSWTPWISFSTPKAFSQLPPGPGICRIRAVNDKELFYLGETGSLQGRFRDHVKKTWHGITPFFSYVPLPESTPDYQRHEIENDLLGSFYGQAKHMPTFQLINHKAEAVTLSVL